MVPVDFNRHFEAVRCLRVGPCSRAIERLINSECVRNLKYSTNEGDLHRKHPACEPGRSDDQQWRVEKFPTYSETDDSGRNEPKPPSNTH